MSEGTVLAGRYRLIQRLGAGAMGAVWRAEDMNLRAPVAIKLIDTSIAESAEAIARFRREAQAAAAIRSTYVVQILDYGVDGNVPYDVAKVLDFGIARRLGDLGETGGLQTRTGAVLGTPLLCS